MFAIICDTESMIANNTPQSLCEDFEEKTLRYYGQDIMGNIDQKSSI